MIENALFPVGKIQHLVCIISLLVGSSQAWTVTSVTPSEISSFQGDDITITGSGFKATMPTNKMCGSIVGGKNHCIDVASYTDTLIVFPIGKAQAGVSTTYDFTGNADYYLTMWKETTIPGTPMPFKITARHPAIGSVVVSATSTSAPIYSSHTINSCMGSVVTINGVRFGSKISNYAYVAMGSPALATATITSVTPTKIIAQMGIPPRTVTKQTLYLGFGTGYVQINNAINACDPGSDPTICPNNYNCYPEIF